METIAAANGAVCLKAFAFNNKACGAKKRGGANTCPAARRAAIRCHAGTGEDNNQAERDDVQVEGDWRAFRAKLVAQEAVDLGMTQPAPVANNSVPMAGIFGVSKEKDWAHEIPEAETGSLLLAPESEQGWWRSSVVLVLSHGDKGGSTGIILNRPTGALLKRVAPEIDFVKPQNRSLAELPVSMGGPLGTEQNERCLVALSRKHLPGITRELFPGLFHVVNFSDVTPEMRPHLLLFVGYCGWVDGQLDREVATKEWTVAAASASHTLDLIRATPGPPSDLMGFEMWRAMRMRLGLSSNSHPPPHSGRFEIDEDAESA